MVDAGCVTRRMASEANLSLELSQLFTQLAERDGDTSPGTIAKLTTITDQFQANNVGRTLGIAVVLPTVR